MHSRRRSRGNQPPGRVRIIGGEWRRRWLSFPDVAGLRPTPDRVRETLFNWLAPVIEGARCLDLFAGSGALGFEAASRGAAEVVLIDQNPQVTDYLREQVRVFDTSRVSVVQADALAWLQHTAPRPFDVVFLDPPFEPGWMASGLERLAPGDWLAPNAAIYFESDAPEVLDALPPGWRLTHSKQAGRVRYHVALAGPLSSSRPEQIH